MINKLQKWIALAAILVLCVFCLAGCGSRVSDGLSALEKEEYDEAITAFSEAIEEEEDLGEAYRGLGLAYWEKEDYDNAYDALKNAVKNSDEELGSTYNLLSCIDLMNENYESALTYIEKAGNCIGNSDELTQQLAHNEIVCYENLGKWDIAKEKMEKYQSKYPDDDSLDKDAAFLATR